MTIESSVRRNAHAKLNLSLRILSREPSGFHSLETLFCLVDLADEVTVTRADTPGVTLEVSGAELGPPAENLAYRAATLALAAMGNPFGVHITLTKAIPVGAGLGGGSSDAAAVLEAVNQIGGSGIPRSELLKLSSGLGSDVPFLVSHAAMALGWGRGERLFELPALPSLPILIVVPPEAVATADAYGWWDADHPDGLTRGPVVLSAEAFSSWGSVARMGANDFEAALFGHRPAIRDLFESLTKTHPLLCRVTGSGSAVFGVYRTETERADAVMQLGSRHGQMLETTNRPAL